MLNNLWPGTALLYITPFLFAVDRKSKEELSLYFEYMLSYQCGMRAMTLYIVPPSSVKNVQYQLVRSLKIIIINFWMINRLIPSKKLEGNYQSVLATSNLC